MAEVSSIFEQDDYDDFEINTCSDLFRFIELRLRGVSGIPPIKGAAGRETLLRQAYEEALGWAMRLRKANPKLIELPAPTPNNEKNLINLRGWCTDPRGHAQQGVISQDIIIIDVSEFSNSKTWRLLKAIIDDEGRKGVKCEKPRTLRSLKERFNKAGLDFSKDGYIKLAKSLKYKNGLAWTTIPLRKICIL